MGCPPVRKIIHSLKLVDYLHVQADNPWFTITYFLFFVGHVNFTHSGADADYHFYHSRLPMFVQLQRGVEGFFKHDQTGYDHWVLV